MTATLGFIGLGNIGSRVVPHLLEAGYRVVVSDLNTAAVQQLVDRGATSAETGADTARDADVVFLSLPSSNIVRAVVSGPYGVLASARPGTIVVDHSTIDPQTAREMAGLAAQSGVIYLDAPVSGGVQGAEAGTLAVMVGGDADAFETARPAIETYAGKIFHVGDSGAGMAIKLANNMIAAITTVALGEALSILAAEDIDLRLATQVLQASSANNNTLSSYFPRTVFTKDRPTGFALDFMLKDINLFLASEARASVPTPLANVTADIFRIGHRDGRGGSDFTSVVEFYEDFSGKRLEMKEAGA